MENITDDQRLENIELKVTICTTYSNSNVVSKDLGANHGHCFALGWVNFAWHD